MEEITQLEKLKPIHIKCRYICFIVNSYTTLGFK